MDSQEVDMETPYQLIIQVMWTVNNLIWRLHINLLISWYGETAQSLHIQFISLARLRPLRETAVHINLLISWYGQSTSWYGDSTSTSYPVDMDSQHVDMETPYQLINKLIRIVNKLMWTVHINLLISWYEQSDMGRWPKVSKATLSAWHDSAHYVKRLSISTYQ